MTPSDLEADPRLAREALEVLRELHDVMVAGGCYPHWQHAKKWQQVMERAGALLGVNRQGFLDCSVPGAECDP